MDERQLQATLLAHLREGVVATDLSGKVIYWNEGAEGIFGYTADEMMGKTPALLYPDPDPTRVEADLECVREGHDYVGDWRGRRKDGSEVWIDLTITGYRSESGDILGYVGISRDITERKRLEQEVRERYSREQAAHRQLRQFLALVSHEMRQPLTVIRTCVQQLQRGTGNSRSGRSEPHLRLLADATGRVQRLMDDIQDAARIGASQFTILRVEMDLVDTVYAVVDEHRQTSDRPIVVDAPGRVWGRWDRDRLAQMCTNLLSNAVKYSPRGSEIRVEVAEVGNDVVIRVIDKGPGIPSGYQAALFEAFSRLDGDSTGFGLGLYICKGIVEAHGGRIWVESEEGHGSQFVVSLPQTHQSTPATTDAGDRLFIKVSHAADENRDPGD